MNSIRIIATHPGDSNFHLFESLPDELYPKGSIRFNQQDSINEEFLDSCFILIRDGKVATRVALYNNPGLFYQNKKACCIGNYESADDEELALKLLNHVFLDAKKKRHEFMIGPMNGSTWDNYRFSLHHNHPSFFLEPYHHLYYNRHFTESGFDIISRYYSSIQYDLQFENPHISKMETDLRALGVSFRNIELSDYYNELDELYELNSMAFKTNFLYTPLSRESFLKKYLETKTIINPEFVIIAEDKNRNVIGYFFSIEDYFNKKEKSLIVKTIARHPDKKWTGLGHVMGKEIQRLANRDGYKSMLHAFIYEQGTSVNLSKNYLGEIYKNYALYGRQI